MKIPFVNLQATNAPHKEEILRSIETVIDKNWYILGEKCKSFESQYAEFCKTKYCVGVGNGLDALTISLKALGVQEGDEVVVPSNTFIATALAVSMAGAKVVLAEPNNETYNIDARSIESVLSKKTKVVIPVHLYGQACNMTEILDLCKKQNVFVVEDNAQAQGAHHLGRVTGSFGDINGTSFYPGKNLGAMGDAGAITTNNETLFNAACLYRNYGSRVKYHHDVEGVNSRLDEIQAALLSIKLKSLKEMTQKRQAVATQYLEQLKDIPGLILPKTHEGCEHVYHLFVIRTKKRDQLQAYLREKGIETMIHYPVPIHSQLAYKEVLGPQPTYPVATELATTSLSLPLYPGLTSGEVEFVSGCLKTFFKSL